MVTGRGKEGGRKRKGGTSCGIERGVFSLGYRWRRSFAGVERRSLARLLGRTLLITSDDSRGLVNFAFRRDRDGHPGHAADSAISSQGRGRSLAPSSKIVSAPATTLTFVASNWTATDRADAAVTRFDCHLHKSIPRPLRCRHPKLGRTAFTVHDSFYASSHGQTDGRTARV